MEQLSAKRKRREKQEGKRISKRIRKRIRKEQAIAKSNRLFFLSYCKSFNKVRASL